MKKIMFNDKYGLTQAVIAGRKTMTRRPWRGFMMTVEEVGEYLKDYQGDAIQDLARYKVGDVIAVAQTYRDVLSENREWFCRKCESKGIYITDLIEQPGWRNKMYVMSELMPHQIKITGARTERMVDISDEDCEREGFVPATYRQYRHPNDNPMLKPVLVNTTQVWTLPKFVEGIEDNWSRSEPNEYMAETPKAAFAVLIQKLMGKKAWSENPYVVAYSFKLIR